MEPLGGHGVVYASDHTFWLSERTGNYDITALAPTNGVFHRETSGIRFWTATHTGPIRVAVHLHNADPGIDTTNWDEIIDFDIECSHPLLVTTLLGPMSPELPSLNPTGPGRHRVRVAVRGRDSGPDHYDSEAPDEEFQFQSWPADGAAGQLVRKQSDRYGALLRQGAPGEVLPPHP